MKSSAHQNLAREPRGLRAAVRHVPCGDLAVDALHKAARMLDSTERIIGYKLRKHGIEADRFRH